MLWVSSKSLWLEVGLGLQLPVSGTPLRRLPFLRSPAGQSVVNPEGPDTLTSEIQGCGQRID